MHFLEKRKIQVAIAWITKNLRGNLEVEFCYEKICGFTTETHKDLAHIKKTIKIEKSIIRKLKNSIKVKKNE